MRGLSLSTSEYEDFEEIDIDADDRRGLTFDRRVNGERRDDITDLNYNGPARRKNLDRRQSTSDRRNR